MKTNFLTPIRATTLVKLFKINWPNISINSLCCMTSELRGPHILHCQAWHSLCCLTSGLRVCIHTEGIHLLHEIWTEGIFKTWQSLCCDWGQIHYTAWHWIEGCQNMALILLNYTEIIMLNYMWNECKSWHSLCCIIINMTYGLRVCKHGIQQFWFDFCFTALQHILGHFGHGQSPWPHCSRASLLGSLTVLSAHSFASHWQVFFLNQQKRENGCRNSFLTKYPRKNMPDVGIELGTACMPSGHTSDRAAMPSAFNSVQL